MSEQLYMHTDSDFVRPHEETAVPQEMLEIVKQELEVMSVMQGNVEFVGKLKDVVENPRAEWTGGVSLEARLESGEVTREEVEEAKQRLAGSFVPTTKGAAMRCIDERESEGYVDDSPEIYGRALGPQIPAGTVGVAHAHRLTVMEGLDDLQGSTLVDDINTAADSNEATDYVAGDHEDDHGPEVGKMGCGAVDGVVPSQEKINPNNLFTINGMMRTVMGDAYNPKHFGDFVQNSTYLLAVKDEYFVDIPTIIETLKARNEGAVEHLKGSHNGVIVNINMVPDTTFHRDHFSAQTDGKIQVFNYDAWYTFAVAKELYPDNPELQSKYAHARIGMAIATLMYLTDGTLELSVRQPSDVSEEEIEDHLLQLAEAA